MAKLKTFKNSQQVAHVWASRSQPEGRTQTGNCFFEQDTIFSYGRHFPLARFVDLPDKKTIVLLNAASYSVMTSGHQREVREAISHFPPADTFTVQEVSINCPYKTSAKELHKNNLLYYKKTIEDTLLKASRSWKYTAYTLSEATALYSEATRYHNIFKLKKKMFTLPSISGLLEAVKKQAITAAKAEAKRAAIQAEHNAFAFETILPAWRRGEEEVIYAGGKLTAAENGKKIRVKDKIRTANNASFAAGGGNAFLRVYKPGGKGGGAIVDTSQGVELLAKKHGKIENYVRILYKLAVRTIKNQKAYTVPPEKAVKIGESFQLKSISEAGLVTAGCHQIEFKEIEYVWKELQE